ncbi:MAG TPA: BON domain-containing protein [Tepidisphaeraceae bacterium]|nr:BON domain-containing protein [Tepidisphaeraceae bacterium]
MRSHNPKNILSLAGGLAAGMVAGGAVMYLLDPSAGRRRRAAIAHATDYAVHHAGDVVHSAGDAIHDAAVSAGEKIGGVASRARRARQHATHAAGKAVATATAAAPAAVELGRTSAAAATGLRRLVDSYHDSAHYLAERVDQFRDSLESSKTASRPSRISRLARPLSALAPIAAGAKSAITHFAAAHARPAKRSLMLVPMTLGGVGCLAAGAGAMYLFDPDRGRDRRRGIRDGVVGMVGKVGRFARHRGRNVRGNVQSIAREVGLAPQRRISSQGYVSGEQLLLRVRGEIARTSGNPRMIQVMTDSQGIVTLTGDVIDSERARVIHAVRQTPGVHNIIDRLRVQPTPGAKTPAQTVS